LKTLADRIIAFNKSLHFEGKLPEGIRVMNPFKERAEIVDIMSAFYKKFYNDNQPRQIIFGINPGRLGSGATGVPFTDTHRMAVVGLEIKGFKSHEPSSVFIYDLIAAYGGPEKFYKKFFITSVCPLGFTAAKNGKEVNYNYYDSAALTKAAMPLILESMQTQLSWPVSHEVCYCMGNGKNAAFLQGLNKEHHYFKEVVPLEHPRFVMQYRSKTKDEFIQKYLDAFAAHKNS
jgi:hypothetical protein